MSGIVLRTKKHIPLNSSLNYVNWFKIKNLSFQLKLGKENEVEFTNREQKLITLKINSDSKQNANSLEKTKKVNKSLVNIINGKM